jgi:hexosaminidase
MKTHLFSTLLLALGLSLHAQSIIPKPIKLKTDNSKSFQISPTLTLSAPDAFVPSITAGLPGFTLTSAENAQLTITKDSSIQHPEGYNLTISNNGINILASTPSGAFYATQSLRQLMPAEVFSDDSPPSKIELPYTEITDHPRFGWRGIMLDSSRHFQEIDEVRRLIDRMAAHKLNVFHWHLTDSHGWRFESKKYPNLHQRGSWRMQPGYPVKGQTNKYGGYYTQQQMREMVEYAKVRGITIVPEIDMPGHCFAWVAAYPMTGCLEKPQGLAYTFDYPCLEQKFPKKVGTDVICVGKDQTIQMAKDIIDEMIEIFPSKFIHIGGDEVKKHFWKNCDHCQARKKDKNLANENELQSWFIQQLDNHISSKNRRLIGWDEILQGGLAKNATVMSWQGERGGIRAAKLGHDVVMSPQTYIYLDHGQSRSPLEPPHWPGHKPLDRAYSYEPIPPQLSESEAKHILGVQGNFWTIFTHEPWINDISLWPRAAAIAEIGWSRKEDRNWDDFYQRLSSGHRKRLDAMGINYWWETSTTLGSWSPADLKPNEERVELKLDVTGSLSTGKQNITFNYTSGAQGLNIEKVTLLHNDTEIDTDEHKGFTGGKSKTNTYSLTVPQLDKNDKNDKLTLVCKVYGDGGHESNGTITTTQIETKILKYLPHQDEYKLGENNLIPR